MQSLDAARAHRLETLAVEDIPTVSLRQRRCISVGPEDPRVSVPGVLTPPFRVRDAQNFLSPEHSLTNNVASVVSEEALGADRVNRVSDCVDVSSDNRGPCRVTRAVMALHAHTGTHADQPLHWLADPPSHGFDERQYTGTATILDVSDAIPAGRPPLLTATDLQSAARCANIELNAVHRLLLRTYRTYPARWDDRFVALAPDAARLLAGLKSLVLLGTDAPSVDAPNAAPIHAHAHGALWRGQVAIVEGLCFAGLSPQPSLLGVIESVWNPMMRFLDAWGMVVFFYPS